jgi:hypothetical protein
MDRLQVRGTCPLWKTRLARFSMRSSYRDKPATLDVQKSR